MNITFETITALLAAAFPAAYLAESYGLPLPDAINSAHAFGAFVMATTVLTLMADYKPHKTLVAIPVTAPKPAPAPQAPERCCLGLAA